MDFGDILAQWDSQQKKKSEHKKGIQKSNKKAIAKTRTHFS